MRLSHLKSRRNYTFIPIILLTIMGLLIAEPCFQSGSASVQNSTQTRRVNVPYWKPGTPYPSKAIFWFGRVDPTSNYADVRLIYDDVNLKIAVHIIDRRLWYDSTPSAADLTDWDSVSVYLNLDGNIGETPDLNSYRFEAQLYSDFQASYRGNSSGWITEFIPINSYTEYRGFAGPNSDSDSDGWVAYFQIPFASLGLSAPPPRDTIWGLGVVMHDRDDAAGLIRQDTPWPETMDPNVPSTWGQLSFGSARYYPPIAVPSGMVTIRQGLNGATVVDADVGGHTTCGNMGADKWTIWGEANYVGYTQINIQNQWDISDWPCFSKFYITFPIDTIPTAKTIISATLSMYLFGTAGGGQWGEPPDSYIQVFTMGEYWNEAALTWNNAPLAVQNISGTWVHPMQGPNWVLYSWDVSRAVAQAYNSGEPLRLALYSADGEYHTGKYFISSDWIDSEADTRPTLRVKYGKPCNSPGVICIDTYLPLIRR